MSGGGEPPPGGKRTILESIDRLAVGIFPPKPPRMSNPVKPGKIGAQQPPTAGTSSSESETGGSCSAPPSSIVWTYRGNTGDSAAKNKTLTSKRGRGELEEDQGPSNKKKDGKKTPSKPSDNGESTSLGAPSMGAMAGDNEELTNLTDDELAAHLQQLGLTPPDPESFADVVNKRKEYPFFVYLQSSETRREPITSDDMDAFMQFYWQERLNLDHEQSKLIKLDWHDYNLGRGLLACDDKITADFFKKLAEHFTHKGKVFRGWLKTEFGDRHTYSVFLGGSVWVNNSHKKTMELIFRSVHLTKGEWKVTKYQKAPNKKGVLLIFEADQTLAAYIYFISGLSPAGRKKAVIDTGMGRYEFKYKFYKGGQSMESSMDEDKASAEEVKT